MSDENKDKLSLRLKPDAGAPIQPPEEPALEKKSAAHTIEQAPNLQTKISLRARPETDQPIEPEPRTKEAKQKKTETRDPITLVSGANVKLKVCPKCKTETDGNATLCKKCSYNFKTGQKQFTPTRIKQIRRKSEIVFWSSLIALTVLFYFRPQMAHRLYNRTLEPYLGPMYERYIHPYLTGEKDPALQTWPPPQSPIKEKLPGKHDADEINAQNTATQQRIKKSVMAEFDTRYPMLQAGDTARFTTTDNTAATAQFLGISEGEIILELNGKKTHGPLTQLAPTTRIRVDPTYRQEQISEQVQLKISEQP